MSLTEVLVALFILTLGVIGILTMFPLGAAQMAMAVRDDRSALAAANADNFMRWYWQTYVVGPANNATTPGPFPNPLATGPIIPNAPDPNFMAVTGLFDNNPLLPKNALFQNNIQAQTWGEMSYPVLVDPMGVAAGWTSLGDAPGTTIPRCTLASLGLQMGQPSQPVTNNLIQQPHLTNFPLRICSLTDTMGFNDNGTPTPDLEVRYNWMWLLQRPQFVNVQTSTTGQSPISGPTGLSAVKSLYTVNMTVVVFDRRTFLYPRANSGVIGYETVLTAAYTTGSTTVTITQNQSDRALDLKPGSWVMDASYSTAAGQLPYQQANFYRVVSLTPDPANANLVYVELQTPISAPTGYPPMGFRYTGTLVALRGVAGVFVRPPLTDRSN
jgi:hypothetical protein